MYRNVQYARILDCHSLKLITVHFDSIEAEMSQPELSLKTKQSTSMYVKPYKMMQIQMSLASKLGVNTRIYSLVVVI